MSSAPGLQPPPASGIALPRLRLATLAAGTHPQNAAPSVRRHGPVRVCATAASWWGTPDRQQGGQPQRRAPEPQQGGQPHRWAPEPHELPPPTSAPQPLLAVRQDLPSETSSAAAVASDKGPAVNGKVHLPGSLYAAIPLNKLPPEGSTLTPEELRCDPETDRCRTPIHVWESRCTACCGTGTARSYTSHRRHRLVSVCLMCSGLGYVRHSTTHADTVPYVNGTGPHTTIGRPPPPPPKVTSFRFPHLKFPGSKPPGQQ